MKRNINNINDFVNEYPHIWASIRDLVRDKDVNNLYCSGYITGLWSAGIISYGMWLRMGNWVSNK